MRLTVAIRTLVLLTSLICVALVVLHYGWLEPLRRYNRSVAALKRRSVAASEQLRNVSPNYHAFRTSSHSGEQVKLWADVKRALVGPNAAAANIVDITFLESPQYATDQDLALIAQIPTVEKIDLTRIEHTQRGGVTWSTNTGARHVTDEGIRHLCTLPRLRWLNASGSKLSDVSCQALSNSSTLQVFSADGTGITDAGLQVLTAIPSLQE
jgi:hypothetical protein